MQRSQTATGAQFIAKTAGRCLGQKVLTLDRSAA